MNSVSASGDRVDGTRRKHGVRVGVCWEMQLRFSGALLLAFGAWHLSPRPLPPLLSVYCRLFPFRFFSVLPFRCFSLCLSHMFFFASGAHCLTPIFFFSSLARSNTQKSPRETQVYVRVVTYICLYIYIHVYAEDHVY